MTTDLPREHKVFLDCYGIIVRSLPLDELMPVLTERLAITEKEHEQIMSERNEFKRVQCLLNYYVGKQLQAGCATGFYHLVDAMKQTSSCDQVVKEIYRKLDACSHSTSDKYNAGEYLSSEVEKKFVMPDFDESSSSFNSDANAEESLISTLLPWELWMVQKAKEERQIQMKEKCEKFIAEKCKREEVKAMAEKQTKASYSYDKWLKRKAEMDRAIKRREREEFKQMSENKFKECTTLQQKQRNNFAKWRATKKEEEKKQSLLEQSLKRLTIEREVDRRLRAEEVYELWLSEVEERHIGRGYSTCVDSKPSYCNPNPWVGPCDINTGDSNGNNNPEAQGRARKGKTRPLKNRGKVPAKKTKRKIVQPLSPPLLFKWRRDKAYHVAWGRQR